MVVVDLVLMLRVDAEDVRPSLELRSSGRAGVDNVLDVYLEGILMVA